MWWWCVAPPPVNIAHSRSWKDPFMGLLAAPPTIKEPFQFHFWATRLVLHAPAPWHTHAYNITLHKVSLTCVPILGNTCIHVCTQNSLSYSCHASVSSSSHHSSIWSRTGASHLDCHGASTSWTGIKISLSLSPSIISTCRFSSLPWQYLQC